MVRAELDTLIAEAKSKGFTHIWEREGAVPLDKWRPYQCFTGNGVENYMSVPVWYDACTVTDFEKGCGLGDVYSYWRLLKPEDAAKIEESEAYHKKRRKA